MSRSFRIISLGEILWDLFPDGARFGGAPANFASHAASLGAESILLSAVGTEGLGEQALHELYFRNVSTEFVSTLSEYPTGRVQVTVDAQGKATFAFHTEEAWDHLPWCDEYEPLASQADAVVFGTLGQRSAESRQTIQRFVASTSSGVLRVYDINLRPPWTGFDIIEPSLHLANLLKLNDEELSLLSEYWSLKGSVEDQLRQLMNRFDLQTVALTLGDQGAMLIQGEEVYSHPGFPVQVKDTVGAGDAFTAALVCGLLRKLPLKTVTIHACRVAAWVCTQSGATPALPDELRALSGDALS